MFYCQCLVYNVVFFWMFFFWKYGGNLYCAGAPRVVKLGRAPRRIMPARAPRYLGTLQPVPRRTRAGSPGRPGPAVGGGNMGRTIQEIGDKLG